MATGGSRAILAAMLANAGIAVAKFVAYLVTGSSSMLAESIHSVADTSNQGLLLLGGRLARRDADDIRQFGYGRERYFWAFVVALVLFALGGLFSIYEGIEKIRHPHQLESIGWAIGVLLFAIVAETLSFRTAIVESKKVKGDQDWWDFIRKSRSPELPVVLLEDSGALVGLVLALVGVSLTAGTGDPVWDAIGTLAIGVLLIVISVVLTVEMRSLLIGESAEEAHVSALVGAAESAPHVTRIIDLRTQHIGPDELLVAGKVEIDRRMSMAEVSAAINGIEMALRQAVPLKMQIYLEPDLFDPHHADGDTNAEER
jgi:cation diffusion facilitator family transporter